MASKMPEIGELVVVRITAIEKKSKSMNCNLLEYDGITGIVARVEGRWKTHKAYNQLKEGGIAIFSVNGIHKNNNAVDLTYSLVESEAKITVMEHYRKIDKIKLSFLKIAALDVQGNYENLNELWENEAIYKLQQKYFAEINHPDIITEFYDKAHEMFKRSKTWSFYSPNVDTILKKDFKPPEYIMHIDVSIKTYVCDAKRTLIETLQKISNSFVKKDCRIYNDVEVLAGPIYRFSIHDMEFGESESDDICQAIKQLGNDQLIINCVTNTIRKN